MSARRAQIISRTKKFSKVTNEDWHQCDITTKCILFWIIMGLLLMHARRSPNPSEPKSDIEPSPSWQNTLRCKYIFFLKKKTNLKSRITSFHPYVENKRKNWNWGFLSFYLLNIFYLHSLCYYNVYALSGPSNVSFIIS